LELVVALRLLLLVVLAVALLFPLLLPMLLLLLFSEARKRGGHEGPQKHSISSLNSGWHQHDNAQTAQEAASQWLDVEFNLESCQDQASQYELRPIAIEKSAGGDDRDGPEPCGPGILETMQSEGLQPVYT